MLDFETAASVPLAIGGVGLLLLAAWSAGSCLIRSAELHAAQAVDRLLLSVTCGFVLLGCATVVADQCDLLATRWMTWILAAIGVAGLASIVARARLMNPGALRAAMRSLLSWQLMPFWWLAVLTLGPALCIPAGWDELVYHHVLPQRWLRSGELRVYDDLPYSGFPALAEVLCLLIAPLDALIAPRLFNWCCCVLFVMTVARVLSLREGDRHEVARSLVEAEGRAPSGSRRARFGDANGRLAPFRFQVATAGRAALIWSIACCPALLMVGQNCYVESLVALILAAMLLAIVASSDTTPVVVVSLLAAGATAVKLTGMIVPVIAVMLIVVQSRDRIRHGCIMLAVFAAIIGPFYFRPWEATGNPFHPYFASWFVSDAGQIASSEFHHAIGSASFGMRTAFGFVFGPLLLAFMEDLYDGWFGWQLVVLAGLALMAMAHAIRRKWTSGANDTDEELLSHSRAGGKGDSVTRKNALDSHLSGNDEARGARIPGADASEAGVASCSRLHRWHLVAMTAVLFVFWFFTSQQARFLVPILVPVAILAMEGLSGPGASSGSAGASPSRSGGGSRVAVFLLIAASLTSLPWRAAGYYAGAWESLAGVWTREEILDDATGGYYVPLLHAIDEKTPTDARLLLLFEHRGLYMPRAHLIGTPYFQTAVSFKTASQPEASAPGVATPDAFVESLRMHRITHVVIANSPIGPDQAPDYAAEWRGLYESIDNAVAAGKLKPVWTSDEHTVLKIDD